MTSPRVALMGMILESNRYSKPASKADFDSLTWMGGNALMAQARSETPSLAQEFAAFVRGMDATGPWTPVPVLLAACHPHPDLRPTSKAAALTCNCWVSIRTS